MADAPHPTAAQPVPPPSLYRTLADLATDPAGGPPWCNVYVRLLGRPYRVEKGGGRWQVDVAGLGGDDRAIVSVHRDPPRAEVSLPYARTSPELLELFDDPALARLLVPGEVALVQAHPRRGAQGLFLNVPHVLVVRPFRTYGRQQIDPPADGRRDVARRKYLAVVKGVGSADAARPASGGGVGGFVAEDVFRAAAARAAAGRPLPAAGAADAAAFVGAALSADTIGRLGLLSLAGARRDVESAIGKGLDALATLADDPVAAAVLGEGPWAHESASLRNGVDIALDFLSPAAGRALELKHVSPAGANHQPGKWARQVEASVAWAMVEYGVEDVSRRWTGYLLNLHSGAGGAGGAAAPRLVRLPADDAARAGMPAWAARRVRDRHRLVAMGGGAWLPSPHDPASGCGPDCDWCERAGDPDLPHPCAFHCQTERHWDCVSADGSNPCPLIGVCDQHDKYPEYERADLFNGLRAALLDEEESAAAAAAVREALAAADPAGLSLGGFTVAHYAPGRLRVHVPPGLRAMEWAARGARFEVLRGGRPVGLVTFQRRHDERTAQLVEHRPGSLAAWVGEAVALRSAWESAFPVRAQLRHLEALQRAGEEPASLRAGGPVPGGPAVVVARRATLGQVGPTARLVVVDAAGRAAARDAARSVVRDPPGGPGRRTLVVCAAATTLAADLGMGDDAAELSDEALADAYDAAAAADPVDRVEAAAARLRLRRVWVVSLADFFGDGLAAFAADARNGRLAAFDDVVVADAEAFPLVGLNRCLTLSRRRVVLVGQSAAGGPVAHSPAARASVLFQNPVRLLADAGSTVLPPGVPEMEVVRLRPPRAARGACAALGLEHRAEAETPVHWQKVHAGPAAAAGAPTIGSPADLRLTAYVPASPGSKQAARVELVVDPRADLSVRHLRMVLKGLRPQVVEALAAAGPGRVDRALLGCRATVGAVEFRNADNGEHEVTIRLPALGFPWAQDLLTIGPAEAAAVVQYAAAGAGQFHATSPFLGQCHRIAELAADRGLADRLRVVPLDLIGAKPLIGAVELLVSVPGGADPVSFPYPLSDASRLTPALFADYAATHLFCTADVADRHPLLRAIAGRS